MSLVLAAVVGGLVAMGTFLLLRRNVLRAVWGITVLAQAVNVYLIGTGGIVEGTGTSVPILTGHGDTPVTTDPLVQALVLTAIVISFGTTAFALALTYRAYQENESIDLGEWT